MSIEMAFYMAGIVGAAYLTPNDVIHQVAEQARTKGHPIFAVKRACILCWLAWPVLAGAILVEMWRDEGDES